MARWLKVKVAMQMLSKHPHQCAVDHHNDKKVGWNRRIKLIDGRLFVNVDEYRSFFATNSLTRKRLKALYFELEEKYGQKKLYRKIFEEVQDRSIQTVYEYFNTFKLKDRKSSLEYYLALKKIQKQGV